MKVLWIDDEIDLLKPLIIFLKSWCLLGDFEASLISMLFIFSSSKFTIKYTAKFPLQGN